MCSPIRLMRPGERTKALPGRPNTFSNSCCVVSALITVRIDLTLDLPGELILDMLEEQPLELARLEPLR